jgi:exonuclease SbcD
MTTLILGDVHLGKSSVLGKTSLGSFINSRTHDQLDLLEWVLDQATEHLCNQIIITGDVFEDPVPHPTLLKNFISWLKKCQAYNLTVHIVVGNHDILRSGNLVATNLDVITETDMENIHVYKSISTIYHNNVAFTMLPFKDRKSFATSSNEEAMIKLRNNILYEFESIPQNLTKVAIGHFAIEGSIFVGDEVSDLGNELFITKEMMKGYDYVWMGHVHKQQIMQKSPLIEHTGSMDLSDFGEVNHIKNIILFNPDNVEPVVRIPIPTRKLAKIEINVPEDIVDTTEYVKNFLNMAGNLKNTIVKVEVSHSSPSQINLDKNQINKILNDNGVFAVTSIVEHKKSTKAIKKENKFKTDLNIEASIKLWAESKLEEDLREPFISLSTELYKEFLEGKK